MRFITTTALTTCLTASLSLLSLPASGATGTYTMAPSAGIELVPVVPEPTAFATTCIIASALLTPDGAMAVEARLTLYDSAEPAYVIVTAGQSSFRIDTEPSDIPELVKGFNAGGWLVVMPLSAEDASAAADIIPRPVGKQSIFVTTYDDEPTPQGCIQLMGFLPVMPEDLTDLPPPVADTLTRALNQARK